MVVLFPLHFAPCPLSLSYLAHCDPELSHHQRTAIVGDKGQVAFPTMTVVQMQTQCSLELTRVLHFLASSCCSEGQEGHTELR